jgi:type II secretory pathway pseudopilin PulG
MNRRGRTSISGFSLVELLVVGSLMSLVTLLIAQFWTHYSSSIGALNARAAVSRELRIATQSFLNDLGPAVSLMIVSGDRIQICQDGGDHPDGIPQWTDPDTIVEYYQSGDKLYRAQPGVGSNIIIAEDVHAFFVTDLGSDTTKLELSISRGDTLQEVAFHWSKP